MRAAMDVEASTRAVFVLGRHARLDARELHAAWVDASEVVVLSLGYPMSRAQRRVVDAALVLAERSPVSLDLLLVTDPSDLIGLVGAPGRLDVRGSWPERRRLHRRLSRR